MKYLYIPAGNIIDHFRRYHTDSATDWAASPVLLPGAVSNGGPLDDEHKLIARYAAKLSGRADVRTIIQL